jgi:alcohol dehydrogenase/L-iditol 2-dehydrogenase
VLALVNFGAEPHSVELRDLPEPEINEDEVLLEVGAVGICGSDLHQYTGQHSWKVNYPVVLGHEFGGVIAKTGARVRKFREGDRVVSETAAVLDLDSPFMRTGQYNLDPNRLGFGYGVHGAMTRFVRVPERCLHRLPENLPLEKAALTEPCCVAYNAVCMNAHIRPGDSVAVIGPGPIGLLCSLMAKLSGASPLIVIGVKADAKRLAVARTIGATHTFGEHGEDVKKAITEIGDGYGVDVVIDAAGVSATLQLALAIVRPGGQISKVGWGRDPVGFSLDPLVAKAVTLRGSFSHNWPMWEKVLGMLASGQINLDPILNRVAPLQEWKDCFDAMHHGDLVKAVLKP